MMMQSASLRLRGCLPFRALIGPEPFTAAEPLRGIGASCGLACAEGRPFEKPPGVVGDIGLRGAALNAGVDGIEGSPSEYIPRVRKRAKARLSPC